jgi:hypothetical protein
MGAADRDRQKIGAVWRSNDKVWTIGRETEVVPGPAAPEDADPAFSCKVKPLIIRW